MRWAVARAFLLLVIPFVALFAFVDAVIAWYGPTAELEARVLAVTPQEHSSDSGVRDLSYHLELITATGQRREVDSPEPELTEGQPVLLDVSTWNGDAEFLRTGTMTVDLRQGPPWALILVFVGLLGPPWLFWVVGAVRSEFVRYRGRRTPLHPVCSAAGTALAGGLAAVLIFGLR